MEMHQVRYFLAVCSERNFTRAARLCNVTQPSLTRGIQLLEAEFGGFLFHRERANTRLTELGELIRPHLMEVLEQTRAAKFEARKFSVTSRPKLKIGVMCTIAPTIVSELLTRLRTLSQTIELQIVDGTATDLEDQLIKGRINAAIYCRPGCEADSRLNYHPLFREQMLIVISQNHRLANQAAVRVTDLVGERYVLRSRCEFNVLIESVLNAKGVKCEMSCSSERDDWALALISNNFGFGLLARHSINHPDVVSRPLTDPELWREVNLVTVKGRRHSRGLGAFLHEAMQVKWANETALAIQAHHSKKQNLR